MIPVDKAVIAKLESQGHRFEVLVDADNARRYRNGEGVALDNVIASDEVYSDSAKGKRAAEETLKKVFGTSEFPQVLLQILKKGEIQLTTDQKRRMMEEKKKQIVTLICTGAVDPRTHAPHPRDRIERMMEEHKIKIDPAKSAQEQMNTVLSELKKYLPISMETDKIWFRINVNDASRVYGILKQFNLTKEEWKSNGDLEGVVTLPAGMQSDFYDKLNKACSNPIETKVIERV